MPGENQATFLNFSRTTMIILLCPNHHKEFDLGTLVIKTHNKTIIDIELNGERHKLKLTTGQ